MGMYSTETIIFQDSLISTTQQPELESSSYLEHHGIKGQKWGVRRYQNPDGSLTKAGRSRYGVGPTKYKIRVQSPFEKQKAKLKEQEKIMTQKEEIQTRKNQLKEREANLKDLGKSQETLRREEMKRLEKELKALQKQDEKEAKKFKMKEEREARIAERKEEKAARAAEKKAEKAEQRAQEKADKKAKEERDRERAIAEEEAAYKYKQDKKLTKAITTKRISEMTNEELQAFVDRYKLEQEYKKTMAQMNANKKSPLSKAASAVGATLAKSGQEALGAVSKKALSYVLDAALENVSGGKIKSEVTKEREKEEERRRKEQEKEEERRRKEEERRRRESGNS